MAKRCFDILVSFLGLLLVAPVCVAIATAIWFTDGSPILFRQQRMGRRGLPFTLFKFRTMHSVPNAGSGCFDAGNTSRVTCIGRILRKTKLDELPQLWNVLRGDMSLVGPRPEVETWVAAYPERWALVHTIRPGITDPASIVYRHEESTLGRTADPEGMYRNVILPEKLSLYEQYVQTRSFWGDIHILFRTAVALLTPYHSNAIGRNQV